MPTPHLSAESGAFASTVLMPGDPLRAQYIAETFLDDPRQVTAVRNMYGYTGTYQGQEVSVQGSGMGIPSMQIYATELIQEYGVERIIRVGSCGAIVDDLDLGDVVMAMAAGTDSTVNRTRLEGRDFPAVADYSMLTKAVASAEQLGLSAKVGSVFTSDFFYDPGEGTFDLLERHRFLAVEMEAAGLYGVATSLGASALAICTVSDHIKRGEAMSVEDRQTSFDDMIRCALGSL